MTKIKLFVCMLCAQYLLGCAYISNEPSLFESPSKDNLEKANKDRKPIKRVFQTSRMALDTLPVGSVIAYFPSSDLSLPENWLYCDGSIVEDDESSLDGLKLPNLTDNRFLMGSLAQFGLYGGENELQNDGSHIHQVDIGSSGDHNHTGLTGVEENNGVVKEMHQPREINVRITEQGHKHVIKKSAKHSHNTQVNSTGIHDHGGDSRPKFFGILYIIKIK